MLQFSIYFKKKKYFFFNEINIFENRIELMIL